VQNGHLDHGDASAEIKRLQAIGRCKRSATEDDRPLRQIFNDVCQSMDAETAQLISFTELENAMYKRRRLAQPALPTSVDDADSVVGSSRYAQLNGDEFYRGLVSAAQEGSALAFASRKQLEMLQTATEVYFDATFKVVPNLYYQLFTVFVPYTDTAFPVFFALMSRKTQALYIKVFEKMHELAPQFAPTSAMTDFEESSVSAFRHVFGDVNIKGCWFHFANAIIRRVQKVGLKDEYVSEPDVQDIVRCLLGLPLLPANDITPAFDEVTLAVTNDNRFVGQLNDILHYARRQWIQKRSIGPARLCVRDNRNRTNNIMESFHAALNRRIQVSHPNLFTFLGHLQHVTTESMHDMARLTNGLRIRRPKTKRNLMNETRIKACVARFDSGAYTRMQFLRAVSHSVGAHTAALQPRVDATSSDEDELVDMPSTAAVVATTAPTSATDNSCCEVCLIGQRDGVALVPCGHARFCGSCVDRIISMGTGCPICRTAIQIVMRIYN
jgi:hypothetical protein